MGYSVFKTKKMATDKRNLKEAVQMIHKNLEVNKEGYEVYNIINFGRLLEVEAYYHEVDEYYYCVGFEVEIESQFSFGNKEELSDLEKEAGFFAIWIGKSHEVAPFTFEESYQPLGEAHRFDNGLGDYASVTRVIASMEEVQEVAKGILA